MLSKVMGLYGRVPAAPKEPRCRDIVDIGVIERCHSSIYKNILRYIVY